ncbi:triose-phosphate transporter family-domain-containing protein [Tirmania nivea]|nr:triose-phosphate transporter family-domain-containing protein [Tirmania nivea]
MELEYCYSTCLSIWECQDQREREPGPWKPNHITTPQQKNSNIPTPSEPGFQPPRKWPSRTHPGSISDKIGRMRARAGSASAGEIVEALKAPVSVKLVVLCLIWYFVSGLSNTTSKSILNAFPQPVTLTVLQFAFVSGWCITLSFLSWIIPGLSDLIPGMKNGLRPPSRAIIRTTAPLSIFQVFGHIFSSVATGRIAVSLVHTIKGMSPLFTVFAYRFLYQVHYSTATYLSLIPLTIGVMLACSAEFRGNFIGVISAFGSAIIFVSQNIFAKKIFNASNQAEAEGVESKKLDKLNLLCYSSGMAFLLTLPLWLYSEGFDLMRRYTMEGKVTLPLEKMKHPENALTEFELIIEFCFNGTVHFGQNILAFILLGMISPVTYSIASLIKRVFVICMAIIWFGQKTTSVQAAGIALTFLGLYLYDRAGDVSRKERQARVAQAKAEDPLLPLSAASHTASNGHAHSPHLPNNGFEKITNFNGSLPLDSRSIPIAV